MLELCCPALNVSEFFFLFFFSVNILCNSNGTAQIATEC